MTRIELSILKTLKNYLEMKTINLDNLKLICNEYINWLKWSKDNLDKDYKLYNLLKIILYNLDNNEIQKVENIINETIFNLDNYIFIIFGDYVISKNDNERHAVIPQDVEKLYNLKHYKNKIIVNNSMKLKGLTEENKMLIKLNPRNDGNYNLYERILEQI